MATFTWHRAATDQWQAFFWGVFGPPGTTALAYVSHASTTRYELYSPSSPTFWGWRLSIEPRAGEAFVLPTTSDQPPVGVIDRLELRDRNGQLVLTVTDLGPNGLDLGLLSDPARSVYEGQDTVVGSALADRLIGGAGADTLIGGAGADQYWLDTPLDVVVETAGQGRDWVHLTFNGDYVLPDNVEDGDYRNGRSGTLTGNALSNDLWASLEAMGPTTLIGGGGNDGLYYGDVMIGGVGNDRYYILDDASLQLVELADEGIDTVNVSNIDYTLGLHFENLTWRAQSFTDAVELFGNAAHNFIEAFVEGDVTLSGLDGDDIIWAGKVQSYYFPEWTGITAHLDGGEGDDILMSALEHSTLDGGAGSDTLSLAITDMIATGETVVDLALGAFSWTAYNQFGDVPITGTLVSIENVIGSSRRDMITGDAGDNRLEGRGGDDVLDGGDGEDTAIFSGLRKDYQIIFGPGGSFYVTGPNGNDTLLNIEHLQFADQRITLADLTPPPQLFGTIAGETIEGTAATEHIYGRDGDDVIFAGSGTDILYGEAGNDTLVGNAEVFVAERDYLMGGAGDDTLYGEAADFLDGGDGHDVLIAINSYSFNLDLAAASIEYAVMDWGHDTITAAGHATGVSVFASGGNDNVTGSSFDDLIFGGVCDDILIGGDGNDALVGDLGFDSLSGGAGNDRIYFDAQDTVYGGAGYDAGYIMPGTGAGETMFMFESQLEFVQDLAGGDDRFYGDNVFQGLTIYAGAGADTVTGSAHGDIFWGEAGNDTLSGRQGDDILVGGAGADRLDGGLGVDNLYGGASDGAVDTFVFQHTGVANRDFIYEFELAHDRIDLSFFTGRTFADVSVVEDWGHSHVSLNGQIVAIVAGVTGLTAANFVFASSGSEAPLILPDTGKTAIDILLVRPLFEDKAMPFETVRLPLRDPQPSSVDWIW